MQILPHEVVKIDRISKFYYCDVMPLVCVKRNVSIMNNVSGD